MIFLPGVGDKPETMSEFFTKNEYMPFWTPKNCRIVIPKPPLRPITANKGLKNTAWFDVYRVDRENMKDLTTIRKRFNQIDLQESAAYLNKIILDEQKLLPGQDSSRIIVGGFSQGGMTVLATLLKHRWSQPLGAAFCLSGS
jgi:predicted esterase